MSWSAMSGMSGMSALFFSDAAAVAAAPVLNTTNLWGHWRANTGVTESSNNVTAWAKIAGSGTNTTFANSTTTHPVLTAVDSLAANKSSIRFGASSQAAYLTQSAELNTTAGFITWVGYFPQTNDAGCYFSFQRPATAIRVEYESNASGQLGFDIFNGSQFSSSYDATASYTANTLMCVTTGYDGTTFRVRVNGTEVHNWVNTHYLDTTETGGGGIEFSIGGTPPTVTENIVFSLAEFCKYTAYNNTVISNTETQMMAFYGIS